MPRTKGSSQSGETLVEVLVAVGIAGVALALVLGSFADAILQADSVRISSHMNSAAAYETEQLESVSFPTSYSKDDCFPSDGSAGPSAKSGSCPAADDIEVTVTTTSVSNGTNPGSLAQYHVVVKALNGPNQTMSFDVFRTQYA